MGKVTIAVVRVQDGWLLLRERLPARRYDYRIDAEEAGFRLTRQIHGQGRDVELLVQHEASYDVSVVRDWLTIH